MKRIVKFTETKSFLKTIAVIIVALMIIAPAIVFFYRPTTPSAVALISSGPVTPSEPEPQPGPSPGPEPWEPPQVIIFSSDGGSTSGGGGGSSGGSDDDPEDDKRYHSERILPGFEGSWFLDAGDNETELISLLTGRFGHFLDGTIFLSLSGMYKNSTIIIKLILQEDGETCSGSIYKVEKLSQYGKKLYDPISFLGTYDIDDCGIPDNFTASFSWIDWDCTEVSSTISGHLAI
jgi:hypothetical protein